MVKFQSYLLGFASCVLLVACASASFPYHYYPYDIASKKLIGATPQDDLPDSTCDPRPDSKYPCTCLMTPEFFKMKAEYLSVKEQLIACQQARQ